MLFNGGVLGVAKHVLRPFSNDQLEREVEVIQDG